MTFGHNEMWQHLGSNMTSDCKQALYVLSNDVSFGHSKLQYPLGNRTPGSGHKQPFSDYTNMVFSSTKQPVCDSSNSVVSTHNQLLWPSSTNRFSVTSQILWPLITTNYGACCHHKISFVTEITLGNIFSLQKQI